jgi:hypothetical protein
MPRLRLFEFEDQLWFPKAIRDAGTDYIRFMAEVGNVYDPIIPKLKEVVIKTGSKQILDICSGGAGPAVQIQQKLAAIGCPVRITLSDKYPNLAAFQHARARSGGGVDFIADSVDATAVPPELAGLRTLFASLHHFPPDMARRILQDAVAQRRPIAAFDMTAKTLPPLPMLLLANPLAMLLATPFVRPFRWSRLFWTYLIPIVPLFLLWDAFVSGLRLYSIEDLQELVEGLDANDYVWEIERHGFPRSVTYLIGSPCAQQDQYA